MDKRLRNGKASPAFRRTFRSGMPSPFVGRDDELRRLNSALAHAAEGQGSIVLLTGEPGIGKTRLAREALALAKGRRFTAIEGCAYPAEAGLSYAPVVGAFRPLLRSLDPGHLETLVADLPSLGRIFEGLRLPASSLLLVELGDPNLEKVRLFEAILRLLERLTKEAPVVLFVDDLQWADPASLELLHYVARGLADQRALMLATCRTSALNNSPALQTLIGSLERDGLAREIAIPRLGPEAVDKLAHGILGGEAPDGLLALLEARADGTPLFVEALITALVDSGKLACNLSEKDGWVLNVEGTTALPPTVRRLILERLARLEPASRRVLDMIAIMGDAASYHVLRAASGMNEETLVNALQHLRVEGLVAEGTDESDVTYSLTHPLVQEVAYAELSELARRRAHLAIGKALESFSEGRPDDVNRIARHYIGAGSEARGDRALAALLPAGDRALALYANEEARRHYAAALELVRGGRRSEGGGDPPSILNSQPSTLSRVLERLGEALERTGKREAAMEAWNEALAGRERAVDPVAVSRLRRQLALAEWDRGQFAIANAHLEAGLAALSEREPCREVADLHFARLQIRSRLRDAAGVAAAVADLLSVAEGLASPVAEAEATLAASTSCLWQNDVSRSLECALHALNISESFAGGQDLGICCRAHNVLCLAYMRLGDHQSMRDHAERGVAIARRLGTPTFEVILRSYLAHANFMAGVWGEALRLAAGATAQSRRVGISRNLAYSLAGHAMIAAFLGDLSEAEACISEARMAFGSGTAVDRHVFGVVDIADTAVALERGQVERALGIARGFAGSPASAAALPERAGLTPAFMPIGLMLLAEAQVAAGDAEGALGTAGNLTALGPTNAPYPAALASRSEGLARRAFGQYEAAIDCLSRARNIFTDLGMPFEAARALLEEAEAGAQWATIRDQSSGNGGAEPSAQRVNPVRAAQKCLAVFERLGAQLYADRARRLLHELGVSPPGPRRPRLAGIPLSAREFEIAQLVTEGLTTPEVAKRLSLSRFTVATHLQHIYARMGITSRTALARVVTEAGLAWPKNENT